MTGRVSVGLVNADPSPNIDDWEFTVPANRVWGSTGYVLYRAKHIALSVGVIIGLAVVPIVGFSASPAFALPAVAISSWIVGSGRVRAFQLAEGLRLRPWTPWGLPSLKSNAGRTLTPEFAQYQPLLDKAWLERQARLPKCLQSRHSKRDAKGRYTA